MSELKTPQQLAKEAEMRKQKAKMERQFSAVPYLIFVFVGQLMAIFLMNLVFLNLDEHSVSYEEKVVSWFLSGVFYIMYFNGIVKFVRSFYEIMKTSRIDDSDLVAIDAWLAFGMGVLFALYGLTYAWMGLRSKRYLGYASFGVASLLWLQSYLMRKFYIVAAEN
jgi:cation transport ATPase